MAQLWNLGLIQAGFWLKSKKRISSFSFNYWLTGARVATVVLDDGSRVNLSEISSDLEREILRKLAGSYDSFFTLLKNKDKRARPPWKRTEDRFSTLSWSQFSIDEKGVIRLPCEKDQPIKTHVGEYLLRCIDGKGLVYATISLNRDDQFELALVTAEPAPPVSDNPKFFRSIDLGAGYVAVTDSDGSEFVIPTRRPDKFWRRKVKIIDARAENRKKDSLGWKRLMRVRRKIWNKSCNQHTSHQRKLAHALLERKVECLIIGKPKTRLGLAQSKSGTADEHWGSQNTGYMFRQLLFLKEKAVERGVRVVEIPDPKRTGEMENPDSKFFATRAMLKQVLDERKIPDLFPGNFSRKHFYFKQ
jgi:putative transposase